MNVQISGFGVDLIGKVLIDLKDLTASCS